MRRASLLIYAKPPRMGLAKTRLARGLGSAAEARRIAFMTLARTLQAARQGPWQVRLYTTPQSALHESLGGLWPATLSRFSQGKGNLTDRLNKGLHEAPMGPVLFIGADAPDIHHRHIRQACRALMRHDAVFGPARDGGFWLFGLNKTCRTRSPFAQVRWSGPHALQDVRQALPASSSICYLEPLIDLDEAEDWQDWQKQRPGSGALREKQV